MHVHSVILNTFFVRFSFIATCHCNKNTFGSFALEVEVTAAASHLAFSSSLRESLAHWEPAMLCVRVPRDEMQLFMPERQLISLECSVLYMLTCDNCKLVPRGL